MAVPLLNHVAAVSLNVGPGAVLDSSFLRVAASAFVIVATDFRICITNTLSRCYIYLNVVFTVCVAEPF